jgi:signal transduction histidine kinase
VLGAIISYVARTGDSVVLADAASEGRFTADPYVAARATRSVLCAPLLNQGKVVAIAYLENDLASGAFTPERLEVIRLLSAQAALSLHNASLYAELAENNRTLEERVGARTGELQQKNDELARALKRLRDTQKQLVTQEKLASLGSLTAGIAHEIKNPLNFVNNFAHLSVGLAEELDGLLTASRAAPEETAELLTTLRQNVSKIHEHGLRANRIIDGMLMHSRSASDERVSADLNSLVAESVNLAYHGMRGKVPDFQLTIDAEYDPAVGAVQMVVSDISRALINVINNACYAVQEKRRVRGLDFVPRLSVRTTDRGERVEVRVRDNGTGIAGPVLVKVFNPFFTTKPPGDGTGLGLSISHDIIVGRHQGEIRLNSVEGEYAEAVIELPKRAPEAAPAVNPPS